VLPVTEVVVIQELTADLRHRSQRRSPLAGDVFWFLIVVISG